MRMNPQSRFVACLGVALAATLFLTAAATAGSVSPSKVGIQLYSLRNQFRQRCPRHAGSEIKGWGIKYVELAGTYGLTVDQFKTQLDAYGLKPISAHYGYEQFRDHLDDVVRDAEALGLKYVGCAWIPHNNGFDEKTCREAIEVFNHAGEVLAQNGLKFFSHTHGYEFAPYKDGTYFDWIIPATNPKP